MPYQEYDTTSPLSDAAQDALINAEMYPGGQTGEATDEAQAELISAGYLSPSHHLTRAGVAEGRRLYEFYWQEPYRPRR